MKRSPAVAGQFYYGTKDRLIEQVSSLTDKNAPKEDAVGILVPHAGLIYSGAVAGAVYSSINFPGTFIMLGPNHTGLGAQMSIIDAGEWEVPTGRIKIDGKLASRILQKASGVTRDT